MNANVKLSVKFWGIDVGYYARLEARGRAFVVFPGRIYETSLSVNNQEVRAADVDLGEKIYSSRDNGMDDKKFLTPIVGEEWATALSSALDMVRQVNLVADEVNYILYK